MNRTFPASLPRSRTPGTLTGTAPIPVITSRSGRGPCRTDRAPPSSVRFPEWASSNTERSASTACWIRSRPSARGMSVSGSAENPCGSGKAARNRPLRQSEKRFNKQISKRRFRVEQCLGTMKRLFGRHRARCFGVARTHAQMVMATIAQNLLKAANRITLIQKTPPIA